MATLHPYLNFMGNTEEAFNFYKSIFGTTFSAFQRFGETPHGQEMSPEDQNKIMHVSMPISGGYQLMGTDTLASMGHTLNVGNNVSLSILAESEAEADTLFNGLAEGGTITMPLQKTFWNAYFGMLIDKFGISWMINYDYPQE